MKTDKNKLVTPTEAARIAGRCKQAIQQAIRNGTLAVKIVMIPAKRVRLSDLEEWLDRPKVKAHNHLAGKRKKRLTRRGRTR